MLDLQAETKFVFPRSFTISYEGHLESENNIILIPFFSRVYITYWDITIFRYLCLFRGFSFNMCLFRGFLLNMCLFRGFLFNMCIFKGFLFNMCLFKGFYIICASSGAIDLSILNWSIIFLWPLLECQVFLGFSSSRELHLLSRQVYHASSVS